MPSFYIPEGFRPALVRIAAMSNADVDDLHKALATAAPTLKVETIIGHLQSTLKKDIPDLPEIIHTLSNMNNARVGAEVAVREFAHDISAQFAARKDKSPGADTLERKLILLLSVETLVISAKAFDVQHEYEKLFIAARIVTDTRTVFNQAGTEAVGTMIVHNLNIKYSEGGEFKEVFIALDDADIAKLRKVLDRAEAKTSVLEKLIEKTGTPYFDAR
ncbi:MAG TPA: hypothetical protein VME17_07665 [Bryobacteraceae bacterium]|nr:hypothetical protein [Bryobacteraceae bacterium]